ncbi:MAG TPA: hypothetical protein VFN67_29230 [Polyangiales bacterium]|nr:hypothetical protein [Polyangiales bacterium]
MQNRWNAVRGLICVLGFFAVGCDMAPRVIELPPLPQRPNESEGKRFSCTSETARGCDANVHVQCQRNGEFVEAVEVDCGAKGQICDAERVCITCRKGDRRCRDCTNKDFACNSNIVEQCADDGSGYAEAETCGGPDVPEVCSNGECVNACKLAEMQSSYAGCEFYAADLDNAALDDVSNASAQQYSVVVANPQRVPVKVRVEQNDAPFGESVAASVVSEQRVAPGDLVVFKLPRREVDGSSKTGINDGTHTAVSSNAYRVISDYPISAYQFNPLENYKVFSNDASLLLPVSALGDRYTVVAWPQTIGDSKNPDEDFDNTSSTEDLRSFLTIIGTKEKTKLKVELGRLVNEIVRAEHVDVSRPGEVLNLEIGPFDVINLETKALNADFTGTRIEADAPVAVFVGSEASDVPMFDAYPKRQCCADHLEEQLLPDRSAGAQYVIGRMPARARALNNAALPGAPLGVAEMNEPEWIRVVAISDEPTRLRTTLAKPDDDIQLPPRGEIILRADRDFVLDSDRPVHVLEALASQGVTGIPKQYPGGDPSIITIPPVSQFRKDYIFLTPDKYAFDFVTMVAPIDAHIEMDGAPLPASCETTDPSDTLQSPTGEGTQWVVHRCQLAFPEVTNGTSTGGLMGGSAPTPVEIFPGEQHDGAHTIVSDREISIIVYGFDRFVSYAYVGGLNLIGLN